jgi:hypothetical protein
MMKTGFRKQKWGFISLITIFLAVTISGNVISVASDKAEMATGAMDIEIGGGEKGNIHFPHRRHQESLGDCNICHSLFKQEPWSIEDSKARGELVKKQIMNSLCLRCHRAESEKGNKSAPTTCSKCHMN